jgi:hypothetical protein
MQPVGPEALMGMAWRRNGESGRRGIAGNRATPRGPVFGVRRLFRDGRIFSSRRGEFRPAAGRRHLFDE